MRFGPVPLALAEGLILGHNISDPDGRRVMRKGITLDAERLAVLRNLGLEVVYAARLDPGDVPEDEAADRAARVVRGPGITAANAHTGRVNLSAESLGVFYVSESRLLAANRTDGLTIATLPTHSLVRKGQRVATVKVIPFALPENALVLLEESGDGPLARVRPIPPRGVSIVLVGTFGSRDRLAGGLGAAIRARLESLSARVNQETFVLADEGRVAEALSDAAAGSDLVVTAGETAIMDAGDLIPSGIRRAGGRIEHLGLPMDPGHLLLLGYLGDTPVVGAPGCVRGKVPDGFDAVVPRLLTGERLAREDLIALGHGGLLSDPRRS